MGRGRNSLFLFPCLFQYLPTFIYEEILSAISFGKGKNYKNLTLKKPCWVVLSSRALEVILIFGDV